MMDYPTYIITGAIITHLALLALICDRLREIANQLKRRP